MEHQKVSWVVWTLVFCFGILLGTYIPRDSQKLILKGAKIDGVLDLIESHYVDSVSIDDLVDYSINGLLSNLDPHSVYLPPQDLKTANEDLQGNFEGIGVQFRIINDTLMVVLPIANGPSEKVGMQAGDKIIKVNDSIIVGKELSNEKVTKYLKGPKGTTVVLGVKRSGLDKLLTFNVKRDVIPTYSIDADFVDEEKTAYIKIGKFAISTGMEFAQAMTRCSEKGMKQLIIDLRYNGGGVMGPAIEIANMFLKKNQKILYTEGYNKRTTNFYADGKGTYKDLPLTILVDEWSASASEILAGAIQDNDRGLIIGRRTFGKGLVQEQIEFTDGSAIRLTVSRYHTPSGRCIQKDYKGGGADYEEELLARYYNGEMTGTNDSILPKDTTKYFTSKGRVVYGGGGIYPDIQMPYQTDKRYAYLNALNNAGLIFQYAFKYSDIERETLKKKYASGEDFIKNYKVEQEILADFVKYAKDKGITPDQSAIKGFGDKILRHLKAYMGRALYDDSVFYSIYLEDDIVFIRAKKELLSKHNIQDNLVGITHGFIGNNS